MSKPDNGKIIQYTFLREMQANKLNSNLVLIEMLKLMRLGAGEHGKVVTEIAELKTDIVVDVLSVIKK